VTIASIVVGVDGSTQATRALEWARDLARPTDGELVVVHVLGLLEHVDGELEPAEPHREEICRHFEEEWCKPLIGSGARYRCEMPYGSPVSTLLDIVKRESADLLVVGSRGVGGFGGLLLGSTSLQLAEHAPCPVTIVKA